MKTKRLMMCLLLSMALAVTFIPNVVFAAPEDGEEAQGTVTLETEAETVQPDSGMMKSQLFKESTGSFSSAARGWSRP